MLNKKLTLSALILIGLGLTSLKAQQATTSTGNEALGSGGNVAYSVGQVVYTTNTSVTGSVAQGVQQAYEVFSVGVKENTINISWSIFPNPTTDNLTLQIKDLNRKKLSYQLLNIQGKLLETKQIIANQAQIIMNSLPSATYFINVIQGNKQIQSFKIIKK